MAMCRELRSRLLHVVREYQAEQGQALLQGERFVDLEDEACQLGDGLAAALMEVRLEELAEGQQSKATACCPRCQRNGKHAAPEPRLLATRRGEVAWREPAYYCPRCRQAFFPSVENPGP